MLACATLYQIHKFRHLDGKVCPLYSSQHEIEKVGSIFAVVPDTQLYALAVLCTLLKGSIFK